MGAREGDTRPFFPVPTTSTTCILGGISMKLRKSFLNGNKH